MSRIAGLLVLSLALLWAASGRTQDNAFTPKLQLQLLLRALASDANLALRCPDGLRIGVVSLSNDEKAQAAAQKVIAELKAIEGKKVKGLSIFYDHCDVPDTASLFRKIDELYLNIIFLSPGSDPILKQVLEFARLKKIFVITGEAKYVKAGVPLAVVEDNDKAKILINVAAANEQAAKFDLQFLSQAEVVHSHYLHQTPEEVRQRKVSGRDPEYPRLAMRRGTEATLVAQVFITPDGAVENIRFVRTHPEFEASVREAVMGWRFSPLLVNGVKMPTTTVYKFTFEQK